MSESPSNIGEMIVRIFVGARTVDDGMSGIDELSREGAADAANDEAALEALDLLDRPEAGAEIEMSLGRVKPDSLGLVCDPPAAASSESFSPTQDRANHRPPPIPRISRFASRQCLTFLPLLSRGIEGAKPE